jgi:peptidoglycan-N-acetylglucosamine deacetylase
MLDALPDLRLLTLAGAPGTPGDTLADVAAAVHRQIGLAALALGQLEYAEAAAFCGPCYSALALGDPLDLAVTDGRAQLVEQGGAWGAPRVWVAPGAELIVAPQPARVAAAPAHSHVAAREPVAPASIPVGTPLRPRREQAGTGGTARSAIAAARSFVLDATQVGRPAQRPRPEARGGLLQPKLIALALATAVLVLMISRVLPEPAPAETATAEATAVAGPALAPTAAPPGNPLAIAAPQGFSSYLVGPDETLASIAERAGSDAAALANLNRLPPDAPLRPGYPLVLPLYGDGEALPMAPIVARGNSDAPRVALTFDIEIDDATLYGILDVLEEKGVKGTFFVTGDWAQRYPDAARAIVAAGQEIANHSLTHPAFSSMGAAGAVSELDETERIVRELTGASTRPFFRFPYGDSTPELVETVGRAGYVAYHWSADDFAIPAWLAQAAADPAEANGGILLMHGRESTVEALPGYIDQLRAMGLTPTTLGEVLK